MTANDLYQLFVGEIGFPRREYLYEISFWEARRIIRGYRRRYRDMWSAVRWHAYHIMGAVPYTDLEKAGIRRPTDLIKFPWDNDTPTKAEIPTDDEVEETVQLLREMNAKKTANNKDRCQN